MRETSATTRQLAVSSVGTYRLAIRYINGRVLLREHGGVRRFASEVADRMPRARVITPRTAKRRWSGRVWEQTTLLRLSAEGVLLNMAHSAPARHPCQVNVIHDLLVLEEPDAFHPAYAALMRTQLPRIARDARRLVTVSEAVADAVAERFSIERRSISVVPPGISEVFVATDAAIARQELDLELDRPVVAALVDPTAWKRGAETVALLRSIQAARPDVQIVVAGRSTPAAIARSGRRRLPPSRTGFVDLGRAGDEDVASLYQAADVFVSLSRGDGFGLPVVEAARCGAAVVATPAPSIAEHALDAVSQVDDPAEAERRVLELLDAPLERAALAARSKETLAHLRWQRTTDALSQIMDEALNG